MKLGLGSDGVTRGAEGSLFEEEFVLDDIAAKMGVTGASMDFLLNGTISNGVGTRLETSAVALQEFVDGRGAAGVSRILDLQTSSVRDLRFRIGRDGAIGLIIGLCIFSCPGPHGRRPRPADRSQPKDVGESARLRLMADGYGLRANPESLAVRRRRL